MDSVDSALRFLQRQFASVANEESQWNEERMKLQQQVRELENQRSIQEEAYKDAMLRVKMLEFALRQVGFVLFNVFVCRCFLVVTVLCFWCGCRNEVGTWCRRLP